MNAFNAYSSTTKNAMSPNLRVAAACSLSDKAFGPVPAHVYIQAQVKSSSQTHKHRPIHNLLSLRLKNIYSLRLVINNIWRTRNILTRVQVFIWRLFFLRESLFGDLLLETLLLLKENKRMNSSSSCDNIENDEHLIFHCDLSQWVWFLSTMASKLMVLIVIVPKS